MDIDDMIEQAKRHNDINNNTIRKNKEAVNHPAHYAKGGIECIDAIKSSMNEEAFRGFLKGNVQKYIWRYESKEKPLEDLKKAEWYLQRLISEFNPEK